MEASEVLEQFAAENRFEGQQKWPGMLHIVEELLEDLCGLEATADAQRDVDVNTRTHSQSQKRHARRPHDCTGHCDLGLFKNDPA